MDYNGLKKIINKMSPVQRKTEVVVFEEGTSRYIWPAGLKSEAADPNRPYLEGVAAEGERDQEFFDLRRAKGTRNRDVDSVQAHPSELDGPTGVRPDRVKAHPGSLDREGRKPKRRK